MKTGIVVFLAILFCGAAVFFLAVNPLRNLAGRARMIVRSYVHLRKQSPEGSEESIWRAAAQAYFERVRFSTAFRDKALKMIDEAYEDFQSRQDVAKTERESVKELARRVLICQKAAKEAALEVRETEKIYQAVEIAVRNFPRTV